MVLVVTAVVVGFDRQNLNLNPEHDSCLFPRPTLGNKQLKHLELMTTDLSNQQTMTMQSQMIGCCTPEQMGVAVGFALGGM